jgi:cation transport regulator ChaC
MNVKPVGASRVQLTLKGNHLNFLHSLSRGSSTPRPPGCIMWPTAIFVHSVYTIKITQYFRQFCITLTVSFRSAAREPGHTNKRGPLP